MESFAEWGYLGLFQASFLAATVIPLGSEIVLSILIANNYDITLSLFIASVGNWLGGLSSYGIGRLGNWTIIERYFRVSKKKIKSLKIKIDNVFSYFKEDLVFYVPFEKFVHQILSYIVAILRNTRTNSTDNIFCITTFF